MSKRMSLFEKRVRERIANIEREIEELRAAQRELLKLLEQKKEPSK
jgi:hypothetical protein